MAFDLFITISGLCLLVRREDDLLVLLPRTEGDHKHHAVLGSHQRYQPDFGGAENGFVEHRLGPDQTLSLDDFDTEHPIMADLSKQGIAKIDKADVKGLRPDKSYLRFVISDGAPCPGTLCHQMEGGLWKYKNKTVRLATEMHWRIRNVTSEAAPGREGLLFRVKPVVGDPFDVTLTPVNGQLRMYLFHTREDELPSRNPPVPAHLDPKTVARHFCCYFDLFSDGKCDPPTFEAEKAFTVKTGSSAATKAAAAARRMAHDHIGRRYSCVLGYFDDTA